MATTTSPSSSKNDSTTAFSDRVNYPLNIQPFMPIPLTHQQQIYLQQQRQQSKMRMSQLSNIGGKELGAVMQQQDYCPPNEEEDVKLIITFRPSLYILVLYLRFMMRYDLFLKYCKL